jgi:uncharacterized protein YcfL
MKKIILLCILAILVIGCASKEQIINDVQKKVENIEKQEYDKRVADMQSTKEQLEVEKESTDKPEEETLNNNEKTGSEVTLSDAGSGLGLAEDDTTDDCLLLTAEDIKNICGVDTTAEEQEVSKGTGQVCMTMFKTNDPMKSAKISYSGGYNPTPEVIETLMTACVDSLKGERITDYACYAEAAGKVAVVHGKKWKITIGNAMPMEDYFICTPEQVKELGKLVSDRIYD